MFRSLIALLLAVLSLPAFEKEPVESYRARRAALAAKLNDGAIVLFGSREADTGDALTGFRQNDDFYYLAGVNEPGAMLLLTAGKEVLFLPPRSPVQERWTGPKMGSQDPDVARLTGFSRVASASDFEKELHAIVPGKAVIYTPMPSRSEAKCTFEDQAVERLKKMAPAAEIRDAGAEIARLRQIKSPAEIALIEKALRASADAHRQAMSSVRPGLFEYQVAALMRFVFEREGCERAAYAPIAGSGFNSTVLHYSANTRRMQAGDLVVLDVAGEYSGYAGDITRTLPVSGKFTARQREIYDIVLGAQKAVIAAIKPGAVISRAAPNSVNQVAIDYFNSHGKDRSGQPLGKYFIHGISHHLGLNVHDVGSTARPLEPGMVITVEPGIYIPEENLGVRIEDVVLVTETGARVLTASLPKEARDVEKAMHKKLRVKSEELRVD
jgi:Xaa-Pro aminopeptidase